MLLSACGTRTGAATVPLPDRDLHAGSSGDEAWRAAWNETVAAAKREGKVSVNGPTGAGYREALSEFQNAYPDIALELTHMGGREFGPKIIAERAAGQYLWDVLIGGAGTPAQTLKPEGILIPFEPHLILPDAMDDTKWLGGFKSGFYDVEGTYIYAMAGTEERGVYVNRDMVPESALSRVEDLIDPRWKGKIVSDDVRAFGTGCGWGAHFIMVLGEDWVRQLFAQDLVISRDKRQPVEWLVRGAYPIGFAVDTSYLEDLQREGIGKNVVPLAPSTDAATRISQGSSAVSMIGNSPHPNAAKVFVNWLLSREGQTAWGKYAQESSRRLDVTEGPPGRRPDPNRQYRGDVAREDLLYLPERCTEIGRQVIK
jgi:ABC-type Fe3+ transport system substrate-binding protein